MAGTPEGPRVATRRQMLPGLIALLFFVVFFFFLGGYFLVQRQTGTRALATIDSCESEGAGRYRTTRCSGSWQIGGSLLDGGHLVVGDVSGASESDVGKTIEVTLHGDAAYSRDLTLPLMLLGFGVLSLALTALVFRVFRRAAA